MSIFPSSYGSRNITTTRNTTSNTPPLLKEYAIDFDTGKFLLDEYNNFIIVEGLEAVQVRCWLKLKIQRNRYLIYMDEGNKLKSLIGKNLAYTNKNIQSILDEALVDNTYVKFVDNVQITIDGDKCIVEFTINSIYGSYYKTESW